MGLSRENGRENGNYYVVYWGYIAIMEKLNGNYYAVCRGYPALAASQTQNPALP